MADEKTEHLHIEPEHIESLQRNDAALLVLRVKGRAEPLEDVRVARCFPWSLPQSYVSIRSSDGKEICLVKDLAQLDEATRAVLEEELREKIFNPRILKVLSCKSEFGVSSLKVLTDRGEVSFQIRSRDDVRVLGAGRALFKDVDGNLYELHDVDALDPDSRKHFHQYF